MKKILFVDDEKELHPVILSFFPKENFRVICAADGAEGIQKCRNENFDYVILDFSMPKVDGAKFYQILQDLQETKKVEMPPVIFVSGCMDELRSRNLNLTKCALVDKPFTKEDILTKIQELSEKTKPNVLKPDGRITLNPGDVLCREGEGKASMYFVVSGVLDCRKISGQEEVIIGQVGQGDLVGEISIVNPETNLMTVVAIEKSELVELPREKFLAMVGAQPKWIKLMIENLSKKLQESLKRIS